ncbi:MAG: GNAT family N-acetyltransferase [Clostridiaceae bacterium]|nr:GNAT family N-acetyltransferase [Eubacteriales bacterium]
MEHGFLKDFTFERAHRADADAIEALYCAVKAHGRESGGTDWNDEYPTRAFIDDDIENGAAFVLRHGGGIVAAVSMLEEDDLDDCGVAWTQKRSCVIARLCVEPKLQGKHIGEHMMRLLSLEARREGYEATRHLASAANPKSLRLYDRMGYKRLGMVRLYDIDFYAYEMLL